MAIQLANNTLPPGTTARAFRSAHRQAMWAIGFLGLSIVVTILTLTVVNDYFFLHFGLVDSDDGLLLGGSIVQLVAGAGCVMAFLLWFSRAYRNLSALGAQELQFTSRSAVGWWFVPVANFWVPLRIAIELWKGSGCSVPTNDRSTRRAIPTPILLGLWWGTWLLALFLDNFWAAPQRIAVQGAELTVALVVSGLVDIAAATLAIAVVVQIDVRQRTSAQRQELTPEKLSAT